MRLLVPPGVQPLHEHHGPRFLPNQYFYLFLRSRPWRFLHSAAHFVVLYCIPYIFVASRAYPDEDITLFAISSVFIQSVLSSLVLGSTLMVFLLEKACLRG